MKAYYVEYRLHESSEVKGVDFLAENKADAYDRAVYEVIPKKEGKHPYSAWVANVTYNNGNVHHFNTSEGNAY